MFWDKTFWENLLVNYLGSLGAAITLILMGFGGYKIYIVYKKRVQKLKKQ